MIICSNGGHIPRIMRCAKTGRVVRWDRHWCRNGDEYVCDTCGARIIAGIAKEGYEDAREVGGSFLEMVDADHSLE
jgi:predicted RNA-binding Zn-ribbon protein involved in translation (DUF1610 family)